MKKIITALFLMFLIGCTNEDDFNTGKQQLLNQGYTNIRSTGYEYWCCDQKDTYSTGFICNDKNGNVVKGCICSGITKGITIRFK